MVGDLGSNGIGAYHIMQVIFGWRDVPVKSTWFFDQFPIKLFYVPYWHSVLNFER